MTRSRIRGSLAATIASLFAAPALWGQAAAPPPAAVDPAPAPAATNESAAELPDFDALHARNLEAMGGAEAIEAIGDMTITGFVEVPAMGMKGTMKAYHRKPSMTVSTVVLPGMGEIRSGSNGEIGWSIDPMRGPALTEPKELAQQRAMERLSSARMNPREVFPEIEVRSVKEFAGHPCYEVSFKSPDLSLIAFYNLESALINGMRMTMNSPLGEIPMEITVSDYKPFGAILQPTLTSVSVMGQKQNVGIESITFDEIDPAVFTLPEAIEGLIAAKKQAADGDGSAPSAESSDDQPTDPPARRPRPRPRPKKDAPATAPAP